MSHCHGLLSSPNESDSSYQAVISILVLYGLDVCDPTLPPLEAVNPEWWYLEVGPLEAISFRAHREAGIDASEGRQTRACSFSAPWGCSEEVLAACKPEASCHLEPNLPAPWSRTSQPLAGRNSFLSLMPPSLWGLVTAAPADEDSYRSLRGPGTVGLHGPPAQAGQGLAGIAGLNTVQNSLLVSVKPACWFVYGHFLVTQLECVIYFLLGHSVIYEV